MTQLAELVGHVEGLADFPGGPDPLRKIFICPKPGCGGRTYVWQKKPNELWLYCSACGARSEELLALIEAHSAANGGAGQQSAEAKTTP